MSKLTIKQQKYVDEYIKLGNGTQAAINAGYSKSTARSMSNKLRNMDKINEEIRSRTEELHSSKIADSKEVLEYLTEVMRGNNGETVVTIKGDKVEIPPSAKDRIKSAELLGKRYVMWTDKQEVDATLAPVTFVDDIPNENEEIEDEENN